MVFKFQCSSKEDIAEFRRLFGQRVKYFRDRKNLTQEYLAELVEIEQASLSNIERGKAYPSLETLCKISTALGIQPYELYTVEPNFSVQDIVREITEAMYHDRGLASMMYKFFRCVR